MDLCVCSRRPSATTSKIDALFRCSSHPGTANLSAGVSHPLHVEQHAAPMRVVAFVAPMRIRVAGDCAVAPGYEAAFPHRGGGTPGPQQSGVRVVVQKGSLAHQERGGFQTGVVPAHEGHQERLSRGGLDFFLFPSFPILKIRRRVFPEHDVFAPSLLRQSQSVLVLLHHDF